MLGKLKLHYKRKLTLKRLIGKRKSRRNSKTIIKAILAIYGLRKWTVVGDFSELCKIRKILAHHGVQALMICASFWRWYLAVFFSHFVSSSNFHCEMFENDCRNRNLFCVCVLHFRNDHHDCAGSRWIAISFYRFANSIRILIEIWFQKLDSNSHR